MKCERIKIGNTVAIICGGREPRKLPKFPVPREEMLAAGYRDVRTQGTCRMLWRRFRLVDARLYT